MNKLFTLLFTATFYNLLLAQSITAEPASFYGLGEMSSKGHGIFDALGKNAINIFDSTLVNHYNPATYNRLSKGATLYTVSINSRQSWYSNSSAQQFAATPMIEQFTLGFKIRKQMGLSFGLRPFSARGYQINETQFTGLDSIRYNYTGKGAIQDLYLGYSVGLIE
jgi:long-subunit fatty acid transport protein